MAVKILLSDGTTTTGTWKRAEASRLTWVDTSTNYDNVNTERYVDVTFANAGNQVGLWIPMYLSNTSSGTLRIRLQEYSGGVWTNVRTTDNFTISTTFTNMKSALTTYWYFPLTSYAVTTDASKWRYYIYCDTASRVNWYRTTTAGEYSYAAILDVDTSAPVDNTDFIIVGQNYTFTLDNSWTIPNVTANRGMILSHKAKLQDSDTAAHTWTINGAIKAAGAWYLEIGASTPRSLANKLTITYTGLSTTGIFDLPANYQANGSNYNTTAGVDTHIIMKGATYSYLANRITAQANASQANVVTTNDLSSIWANGDTVRITGKCKTASKTNDNVNYTIQSMSGTTITLNTNLDYNVLAGGFILNYTKALANSAIVLNGDGKYLFTGAPYMDYVQFSGIFCNEAVLGCSATPNYYMTSAALKSGDCEFSNLYFYRSDATASNAAQCFYPTGATGVTVSNVHLDWRTSAYFAAINLASCNNVTVTNVSTRNTAYAGLTFTGTNWTITNVACSHTADNVSTSYAASWTLTNATVSNVLLTNGIISPYFACNGSSFTNVVSEGNTAYNMLLGNGINNTWDSCAFGNTLTGAGGYDIYGNTDAYIQHTMTDTYVGSSGIGNMTNTAYGSYLRFHQYATTANDHRGWEVYGKYVSTGTSLADTTVHTAGGFAIRFEPLSSTNSHTWQFTIPSGNIQNKTMMIGVWCKIASATYYAGTHQLPRITVNYDNGTTAYTQASQTTDWQFLPLPFTPTTTYGQITVTLSARTDATTTNAYVYWDDFKTLYPAETPLNAQTFDLWANALPVTPPIATVLSAIDVWSVATSTVKAISSAIGEHVGKKLLTTSKFIGLK